MPGPGTLPIIDDTPAEGRLRAAEPGDPVAADGDEAAPRASAAPNAPSADTGVMPAISGAEAVEPVDQRDAETASATVSAAEPRARVLIVEDTLELAELVVVTLRRAQIAAAYELRGERAFARFVELQPSVILLDLNLPDMTGWKVLESIKDYVRESGAPMPRIIVMTAMGDPANRLVGKLQGVFSYIVKPFTPADMQAAVQNALAAAE